MSKTGPSREDIEDSEETQTTTDAKTPVESTDGRDKTGESNQVLEEAIPNVNSPSELSPQIPPPKSPPTSKPKNDEKKGCCQRLLNSLNGLVSGDASNPEEFNQIDSQSADELSDFNPRGNWGKRLDFLLSCIGYAVGLGNIWRFPFKVLDNGGLTFILVYLFMLLTVAMPLFLVELTIGQFTSRGVSECWHFAPGFKGMGYIMLLMSLFCSLYYNSVISWALYYMFKSFYPNSPWMSCDNYFNDFRCVSSHFSGIKPASNQSYETSTEQFFERHVIEFVRKISFNESVPRHIDENPETLVWHIAVWLVVSWILCAVVLMYGIKVSGKAMYFFAVYPYFVLIILIICCSTLNGSGQGVLFYITPQAANFLTLKVWRDAAEQIFFSLGIGFGCMLTFGSYNKFNNDLQKDVLIVASINSGTSIFAGIIVFEILGNMAYRYDQRVQDMSKYAGSGLIFMAYPEGLDQFTFPNVLLLLFFSMILCLGFDSQLGMMETVITGLVDEFPWLRKSSLHRMIFVLAVNFLCCLFALIFVTKTGYLWFIIMSYYSVATNLLMMGFFETAMVLFVYGLDNFSRDFSMMTGSPLNWYWKICLIIIVPIVTIGLTIYAIYSSGRTIIGSGYKKVVFPLWSDVLGWLIFAISLVPLPLFFLYYVITNIVKEKTGLIQILINSVKPDIYYGPSQQRNWLLNSFYRNKQIKYRTFLDMKTSNSHVSNV